MNITRQQFIAIAPMADAETIDALFAPSADGPPEIDRILAECKITEPPVVAQFMACCSLATDRFTKFHFGKLGVDAVTWLSQRKETSAYLGTQGRALEFYDYRLPADASEWDWQTVAECCATMFPIAKFTWLEANSRLAEVCKALGMTDNSEAGAINDKDWLMAQ